MAAPTPPHPSTLTARSVSVPYSSGQAARSKMRSTLLMLALTAILLPLVFPPFYCFFLAPFALVPFSICILRRPLRPRYLLAYYGLGCAFFIPNLFWLAPVTIGGYIALALFVALYFPLYAIVFNRLVVQLRLPATLALPLAWTAVEYLRCSFVLGGFPWFMLGNCLAPAAVLIQAADLCGVWGLTFLLGLLNGFIVDFLRLPLKQGPKFNPVLGALTALVAVLIALQLSYGLFRLSQNTTRPGPSIAVLQENFEQRVKDEKGNAEKILDAHLALAREAGKSKPDLIAWPETMVTSKTWINEEFLNAPTSAFNDFEKELKGAELESVIDSLKREGRYTRDLLQAICDESGSAQLIGYGAIDPKGNFNDSIKQNRTGIMAPGGKGQILEEYSKVHLVPFGEFIPFRGIPLLGKLMMALTPYGTDYSNTPGTRWTRFYLPVPPTADNFSAAIHEGKARPDHLYTFATPICFEDTMPYPARFMTAAHADVEGPQSSKADFLLNVSNDGWFHWVELDQHLQAAQLRAVENRIPIARAVNTGNSGFIDSNGRVVALVTNATGSSIGAVGTLTRQLQVDSRITFYSKIGDLLPIVCGILCTLLTGWTFVRPRRSYAVPPSGGQRTDAAGSFDSRKM